MYSDGDWHHSQISEKQRNLLEWFCSFKRLDVPNVKDPREWWMFLRKNVARPEVEIAKAAQPDWPWIKLDPQSPISVIGAIHYGVKVDGMWVKERREYLMNRAKNELLNGADIYSVQEQYWQLTEKDIQELLQWCAERDIYPD